MQPVNMPVPTPGPTAAVGGISGPIAQQIPGTIFALQTRDQTGTTGAASTGGISGSTGGVYTSDEYSNRNARGARFYVTNSGAATGTAALQVQVAPPGQPPSTTGPNWVSMSGASLTVNGTGGTALLTVYPGLTGIADATGANNQHLGVRWRATLTMANASGACSVFADYLF